MELEGSYKLNWNFHGIHLHSSISKLYRTDNFTDVVLSTADGRHIPAHQFVLSACSSYLHKMFCVGHRSSKMFAKIFVVLPSEISFMTLSVLLQYMYQGEVIVNHEQLPDVMKAAAILQVIGLSPVEEKPNGKSTGSSTPEQINKNSSVLKNDTQKIKVNHKILIPEVRYSGKSVSINNINFDKSPMTVNELPKRSSMNSPSSARKKAKGNPNEILLGSGNRSDEGDTVIENLKEEVEIEVKEEPIDWEDQKSTDEDSSIIKQETMSDEEIEMDDNEFYVPLTCDLCQKTFTTPALWVRHIEESHPTTTLASGKRNAGDEDTTGFPPLHCEMCKQVFTVPAEWVRHIQSHSEEQETEHDLTGRKVQCKVCGKVLQSQASMEIHTRTHTGECPYVCKVCGRQFSVKSNYTRHMRCLHKQLVSTIE